MNKSEKKRTSLYYKSIHKIVKCMFLLFMWGTFFRFVSNTFSGTLQFLDEILFQSLKENLVMKLYLLLALPMLLLPFGNLSPAIPTIVSSHYTEFKSITFDFKSLKQIINK